MTAQGFITPVTNWFITELQRLIDLYPKPPLRIVSSENVYFADFIVNCRNMYYCFDCANSSDCIYVYDGFTSPSCMDCDYPAWAELCYESVDPFRCFNCSFTNICAVSRDLMFCDNCWNSNDLFGCVNLRNKQHCIFNRQLTPEDYKQKVKEYRKWPMEKILSMVEELKLRYPITQTIGENNVNSDYGNYINNDKNVYMGFDASQDENCAYLYDSFGAENCMDMTYGGNTGENTEVCYEIISSSEIFNCNYLLFTRNCLDSSYLFNCFGVKNCLGCVNLSQKQYCILNRQFSKEEYEQKSAEIMKMLAASNTGWANLTF